MSVWALGLNHNTAPLDLRGRFAFSLDQMAPTLKRLRDSHAGLANAPEATILSTCNRTEIYGASDVPALEHTLAWLANSGGVILGQMKDAVRAAEDAGAMGSTLHQLFQRSFAVAKEVRSSTEIGAHSISMAAAAVRLAGQLFEDLSSIKILFVGAGEMIDLAATHFAAKNPALMVIANRTSERGEALAAKFSAQTMPLADLPARLHEFDAVISCTASVLPIIGLGAVERAVKLRKRRPIFMIDLAVPRDIEVEVKDLPDVYLYSLDDLAQVVQTGKQNRQAAVAEAEIIIDAGVHNFMAWLDRRNPVTGVVPLIQQLNVQADEWRALEINRAKKLLAKGESIDNVLEALARGISQKMLHGTLAELHAGDADQREATAQTVSKLFLRGQARSKADDAER